MSGIVYRTTNLINGRWYIGLDSKDNPAYLGSGKLLNKAIKKYGKESFVKETLASAVSKENLGALEKQIIAQYNAVDLYESYNIHEGGYGGNTLSGDSAIIASEKRKKFFTPDKRKEWSDRAKLLNLSKFAIDGRDRKRKEWWAALSDIEKSEYQSKRGRKKWLLQNLDTQETIYTENLKATCEKLKISHTYLLNKRSAGRPYKKWTLEEVNERD